MCQTNKEIGGHVAKLANGQLLFSSLQPHHRFLDSARTMFWIIVLHESMGRNKLLEIWFAEMVKSSAENFTM